MGSLSPKTPCMGILPSVACKVYECTLPPTLKVSHRTLSVLYREQAPSETLQKHSIIAVKDAGTTAAKVQLRDIY